MTEEQKKPESATATAENANTESAASADAAAVVKKKKNKKKRLTEGIVNIHASYNNTIISITDMSGNVVCWASSGGCGFKGTRKATPYASSVAAETALGKAKILGLEKVHISVKGVGTGRDQALRAVNASGVAIESITDKTAVPHNGCRPRKARRV